MTRTFCPLSTFVTVYSLSTRALYQSLIYQTENHTVIERESCSFLGSLQVYYLAYVRVF